RPAGAASQDRGVLRLPARRRRSDRLDVLTGGRAAGSCIVHERTLTSWCIRVSRVRMRTTLDLPAELIEEARKLLGFKSETDTLVLSLRELVRRRRVEELKSLAGKIDLDIDLPKSRRRPRRGR